MLSYSRISEARHYVNVHFNHHLDFQTGRYMQIRYTVPELMVQCVCMCVDAYLPIYLYAHKLALERHVTYIFQISMYNKYRNLKKLFRIFLISFIEILIAGFRNLIKI